MPLYYRFIIFRLIVRRLLIRRAAAGLCLLPLLAAAGGPGWQPGFNTPGLNGLVRRVVQWRGSSFVAGGDFTDAGGEPGADHVARWNGRRWQALGAGPGFNGPYSYLADLVVLPGGDLVAAGGWDDTAAAPSFVTRWDGHRWQRLGPVHTDLEVRSLAVGPGGELLAGLRSAHRPTASGLLRWDGTAWQLVGPASMPAGYGSWLTQLVVTPAGDIVAAGGLRGSGGTHFAGVGRWDGTAWQPLGPPVPDPNAIRLVIAPDGALLMSGPPPGPETTNSGRPPTGVLRWDGAVWRPFAARPAGESQAFRLTPNGDVLAHGRFTLPGDTLTYGYARYDGTRWQVLRLPRKNVETDRGIFGISARGDILADVASRGLMRWDGRRWHELINPQLAGIPGRYLYLPALAVAPGGDLLLLGKRRDNVARRAEYRVVRWNGRRAHPLPGGPEGNIYALAVLPTGDVVVAGAFKQLPAGTSGGGLLRYDGHRWHDMLSPPGELSALLVAPDGRLLAGGGFGVAGWDGAAWQLIGDVARTPGFAAHVEAMAVAPNGDILAGGPVSRSIYEHYESSQVARWNGASWQVLPEEVGFSIQALVIRPNGEVLAGGSTTHVGHNHTTTRGYLTRWTGQEWQPIGPELEGGINALELVPDGSLVAGGRFLDAGGNPRADYVARWDGRGWQALGMGLNGAVDALRVLPNGDVAVSGNFTDTGDEGLPMWHLGLYRVR